MWKEWKERRRRRGSNEHHIKKVMRDRFLRRARGSAAVYCYQRAKAFYSAATNPKMGYDFNSLLCLCFCSLRTAKIFILFLQVRCGMRHRMMKENKTKYVIIKPNAVRYFALWKTRRVSPLIISAFYAPSTLTD